MKKKYIKKKQVLAFGGDTANQVTGALSGAQTGFGLGNMVAPGIGGLVGAGLGAGVGLINANMQNQKAYNDKAQADKLAQEEAVRQAEVNRQAQLVEQTAYTNSYNLVNPVAGRDGQGIYSNGGDLKGTNPPISKPAEFDMKSYYDSLNKYQSFPSNKVPVEISKYVGTSIVPAIKSQQEKLNMALRAKYKLGETDPITNQFLTPEEGDKALDGGYNNYMTNFNAYQDYRKKTPDLPLRSVEGTENEDPKLYGNRHVNLLAPYSKAYGGELNSHYNIKAEGGDLKPIASNTSLAVGNKHEQGGIDLITNNQPLAEIEGEEVINGSKVYSDRLKVSPGKTYAMVAQKLGNKKGNIEKNINETDSRSKNSAKRMLSHIDQDLENLYNLQEITKVQNGIVTQPVNNAPIGANGLDLMELPEDPKLRELGFAKNGMTNPQAGKSSYSNVDWTSLGQMALPLLDNVVNAHLTNNTPEVPLPTKKVAIDLKPVTLKTDYNINASLNDADRQYQMLNKDFNENTSNSATARANKLQAFSTLLGSKNTLYNLKENTETDLKNKNNMNVQGVLNSNRSNRQTIENGNLAAADSYNWNKMLREGDIQGRKASNAADLTNDLMAGAQDYNFKNADEEKIMTDALQYNDAAGFSRLVGSNTMDGIIRSDSNAYSQIEKALKGAGQNEALRRFYERYGSKS